MHFVAEFTASVQFDQRFYKQDIAGSIAHATMLAKVGVLTEQERDDIINGLNTIKAEIEAGDFEWRIDLRRCAHEYRVALDQSYWHHR